MIQVYLKFCNNQEEINEFLRLFQKEFPKRKIINVIVNPHDMYGWFMTIVYEVNI